MIKTDSLGLAVLNNANQFDLLYQGKENSLHHVFVEKNEDTIKYNKYAHLFNYKKLNIYESQNLNKAELDSIFQSNYLIPVEYQNIDIDKFILDKCTNKEEQNRALEELECYKQKNLFPILAFMIYLVDTLRQNNIVWGVGRGSSVSSFVLYLIGINRINPIKYDLNWQEFLR